jgi:mono/diheme cytochrome c family protein
MKSAALSLAAMLAITSCGAPGRPAAGTRAIRPSEILDFSLLYGQQCSACHGADGQAGLSIGLANPVYLAIADDATIRRITAQGVPGTTMPAFAQEAGGLLTDAQIDALVGGIREHWAKPGAFDNEKPPAYAASQPGNPARGQSAFNTICSSCHGPDGRGGQAGSIVDNSYLALVSDQHLRTVTITGMPHLGMPDWRNHPKPLSDADVTDIVAWLVSQRMPLLAQLNHSGGSE